MFYMPFKYFDASHMSSLEGKDGVDRNVTKSSCQRYPSLRLHLRITSFCMITNKI